MQKLGPIVGNFWCYFVWCAPFWPQRHFEVTEVVMSFFTKMAPPPRDMDTEKMFYVHFFFIDNALQYLLIKNPAHYLRGNFSIFPKGGRSSTSEVPALRHQIYFFVVLSNFLIASHKFLPIFFHTTLDGYEREKLNCGWNWLLKKPVCN